MSVRQGSADVLVIGGGVVGASIAYGLVNEGCRVTVLDGNDVHLRASRGNFGLVWVQSKGINMFDYARWTRHSADLYPEFSGLLQQETDIDIVYENTGGMHFMLSEDEMEEAVKEHELMKDVNGLAGYGAEMVDRRQLDDMMPGLGADVIGGSYCKHGGAVNPSRLLHALLTALVLKGVDYRSNTLVRDVMHDGSAFIAKTDKGHFSAEKIVLAAGHGTTPLACKLGLKVPLKPEKGEILVTERCTTRLLPMPTHVLRQGIEGTVLIGDSHEDTGFSTASCSPVISDIACHAIRCFPILKQLKIVRTWGCVRILSPDGCPVYHQSELYPGAFAFACHSGITLAAAHAMELGKVISCGTLDSRFDSFHPRRFENGEAH